MFPLTYQKEYFLINKIQNEGFSSDLYSDVLTGEKAQSLEEWTNGGNQEPPRKPIDKIESTWSVVENKFEKVVEKVEVKPEDEIKQLKEELQKKEVFYLFFIIQDLIHLLEVENNNLKEQVKHTEEKLNDALAQIPSKDEEPTKTD